MSDRTSIDVEGVEDVAAQWLDWVGGTGEVKFCLLLRLIVVDVEGHLEILLLILATLLEGLLHV